MVTVVEGYVYYSKEYIPKKRLDEAIADIEGKFKSKNELIKINTAANILKTDYDWGYNGVSNSVISYRISHHIKSAFKLIEGKAYEGKAYYQFGLGQLYYHDNDNVENDNTKAVYWWNEAAKQGYTQAYNNVGIAFKEGIGVNKDLRIAVKWLKKGA